MISDTLRMLKLCFSLVLTILRPTNSRNLKYKDKPQITKVAQILHYLKKRKIFLFESYSNFALSKFYNLIRKTIFLKQTIQLLAGCCQQQFVVVHSTHTLLHTRTRTTHTHIQTLSFSLWVSLFYLSLCFNFFN